MNAFRVFCHIAWEIMDDKRPSSFMEEVSEIAEKYLTEQKEVEFLRLARNSPSRAKKYFEYHFGGWSFWRE